MRYVLDTNVVSELRKAGAGQANAKVSAWIANVDTSALFLSAITVMELEIGFNARNARIHDKASCCAPG